jgi:hypothetical protein
VSGQCLMIGQPYTGQAHGGGMVYEGDHPPPPTPPSRFRPPRTVLGARAISNTVNPYGKYFQHSFNIHSTLLGVGIARAGDHTGGQIRTAAESAGLNVPPYQVSRGQRCHFD